MSISLSLMLIAWILSLVLVEKLILNSLHLPSFNWNLSFEAFLLNTSKKVKNHEISIYFSINAIVALCHALFSFGF